MLRNYFKVALRHLFRNKIYVIINTTGMGIAMACCITSYLLIAYNIEFDNYFEKKEVANMVKVVHHYRTSEGRDKKELVSPLGLGPIAKQEITGVEDFTRFFNESVIMNYNDRVFHENVRFADESFFKMFNLKMTSGSQKNFSDQQTIILSPALSKKYFAEEDPIGKTIALELNGKKMQLTVGGVLEKIPLNTSFNIDALLRTEVYLTAFNGKEDDLADNNEVSVLLKLSDINQRNAIEKQMDKYVRLRNESAKEYKSMSYELVPFLHPIINGEVTKSNLRLPIPTIALAIFGTLGLMILLIACFNLTNTTMALAGKRQKEIGVRKVIGSGRRQIANQFLLEMILTISLAIGSGLLMAQVIVPQFAMMWQLQYGLEDLSGTNLLISLIILLFTAATIAGIYPALFNSKLSPVILLRGNKSFSTTSWLTKSLLVGQFSLSVVVLLGGIVFTQNATYQKNLSLGYVKDEILAVTVNGEDQFNRLKNAVSSNARIKEIAGAENHIGPYTTQHRTVRMGTEPFETNVYNVGPNYFNTVGLTIVSGRDFIDDSKLDRESSLIVDQNFVQNHSIKNPLEEQIFFEERPYQIVGVVSNHLSGLKKTSDTEHIYFFKSPGDYRSMVVRAEAKDLVSLQKDIEAQWKKLFDGVPYQIVLQEEVVFEEANAYNTNLKQIFLFLTVLGCLLSVSGIYAMASLQVQKRTKEIGVRKVLGATVVSLIKLLNKDFAIILSLSALIGGAGGYLLTHALLDSLYVQHLQFGLGVVVFSGAVIFIIGIVATSTTIFKAAVANPTDTLGSE